MSGVVFWVFEFWPSFCAYSCLNFNGVFPISMCLNLFLQVCVKVGIFVLTGGSLDDDLVRACVWLWLSILFGWWEKLRRLKECFKFDVILENGRTCIE